MMNMEHISLKHISFLIDCFMSVIAARTSFRNMDSAIHRAEAPQESFSISNQFTLFHFVIVHPLFHLCNLFGFNLRI